MKELDFCLKLYRKCKSIDEEIEEINALLYSPKGQDLSGMPKGNGGNDSIVDKLVDKKKNYKTNAMRLKGKSLLVGNKLMK